MALERIRKKSGIRSWGDFDPLAWGISESGNSGTCAQSSSNPQDEVLASKPLRPECWVLLAPADPCFSASCCWGPALFPCGKPSSVCNWLCAQRRPRRPWSCATAKSRWRRPRERGASDTAKAAHFTADDFSGSNGKKSIPLYIRVLHECLGLIECGIVLSTFSWDPSAEIDFILQFWHSIWQYLVFVAAIIIVQHNTI